jgi:uncharacterized protein YegJ (DUF2314 family)
MKPFLILTVCMLALGPWVRAAEEGSRDKTRRETTASSQTGYSQIGDDDKQMDRAVDHAQKSLGFFIAALRAKKGGDTAFEIKKAFVDGDKVEHIWIRGVSFDGKNFHGKIDNRPVDVNNVHHGQRVTVAPMEVSDWMFVKDGKLIGGYTTRVLYARLSPDEKAAFDKEAQYKIE